MVPLIIVYLHSGRQLLLRGVGEGGHFLGPSAGLRAPFFWASPSTSTSVLEGSSTASARRSALRAGPRGGDSHQPPMSDASLLPQRLGGTCQWWRSGLLVRTQTLVLPADKLQSLCQGLIVPFRPPLAPAGDASASLVLPGAAHLRRGPAALPPAVAPVHALAVLALSVAPRASPSILLLSPKPHTLRGSREMVGALDLVLEVDSGVKQREHNSTFSPSGTASRRAVSTGSVAGGCQLWRVSPPPSGVPTGAHGSESVARSAHAPGRSNGQGLTACHTPFGQVCHIRTACLRTGQSLAQKVRGMGKILQYPRRCRYHYIYHLQ